MGNNIKNTEANLYDSGTNPAQCTDSATGSGGIRSECLSYLYSWCTAAGLDSTTSPTCVEVREDSTVSDSDGSTSADEIPNNNMAGTGIVGKPGGKGGESKGNSNAANQAGIAPTNGSICPAGWRLPVGLVGANTVNEFAILNGAMYTAGVSLAPDATIGANRELNWHPAGSFSAVGSGYFNQNGLSYQSYSGGYWSSALNTSASAAYMYVRSDVVAPGTTSYSKYYGQAVRCVLN